jgi:hypothetical protein
VEARELSTRELLTDRSNDVERGTQESNTTEDAWRMSMERGRIGDGGSAVLSSVAGLTSISRAQQALCRHPELGLRSLPFGNSGPLRGLCKQFQLGGSVDQMGNCKI